MKWALRFLGFASVLAIPCFLLSGPWQRALGNLAAGIVSRLGFPIEMSQVQIMAPFDVGIYAAMCLASRRAPGLARRRALEWGIPIMIGIEVATIVAAVLLYLAVQKSGAGDAAAGRAMGTLIEFVPWASAATVWLLLLGAWELPFLATVEGSPTSKDAPGSRTPRG